MDKLKFKFVFNVCIMHTRSVDMDGKRQATKFDKHVI